MFGDGPAHNQVNRAEHLLSPSTVAGLHVTLTFKPFVDTSAERVVSGNLGYMPLCAGW
jgi:hypothetical protein